MWVSALLSLSLWHVSYHLAPGTPAFSSLFELRPRRRERRARTVQLQSLILSLLNMLTFCLSSIFFFFFLHWCWLQNIAIKYSFSPMTEFEAIPLKVTQWMSHLLSPSPAPMYQVACGVSPAGASVCCSSSQHASLPYCVSAWCRSSQHASLPDCVQTSAWCSSSQHASLPYCVQTSACCSSSQHASLPDCVQTSAWCSSSQHASLPYCVSACCSSSQHASLPDCVQTSAHMAPSGAALLDHPLWNNAPLPVTFCFVASQSSHLYLTWYHTFACHLYLVKCEF